MADLRDIVAYILKNYPHKDELSNARVTKMVYLADWKNALDHASQLTTLNWYFDNYGPFLWDVKNAVEHEPTIFRVEKTEKWFGTNKNVFRLIDHEYEPSLTTQQKKVLDHVMSQTKDLHWGSFIKLVYSTYPVMTSERYSRLNLVAKASEYRGSSPR